MMMMNIDNDRLILELVIRMDFTDCFSEGKECVVEWILRKLSTELH